VIPAAIAWTASIAACLVWSSPLRRTDEKRLLAVLRVAYAEAPDSAAINPG
jgi:hypothetical protein